MGALVGEGGALGWGWLFPVWGLGFLWGGKGWFLRGRWAWWLGEFGWDLKGCGWFPLGNAVGCLKRWADFGLGGT